jgi:hypothetical protein
VKEIKTILRVKRVLKKAECLKTAPSVETLSFTITENRSCGIHPAEAFSIIGKQAVGADG